MTWLRPGVSDTMGPSAKRRHPVPDDRRADYAPLHLDSVRLLTPSGRPMALFGAGGHGRVVADVLEASGIPIGAILDDRPDRDLWEPTAPPVIGGQSSLPALSDMGIEELAVGIGDNTVRWKIGALAREAGLALPWLAHPRAIIARGVSIGTGSVVMAGAILNPGAKIGELAVVNTGAIVEHDCVVGDGAFIGPGAALGGGCTIDSMAFVGMGATVLPRVRVGRAAVVGAGAVVRAAVHGGTVVAGVPARPLRASEGDQEGSRTKFL